MLTGNVTGMGVLNVLESIRIEHPQARSLGDHRARFVLVQQVGRVDEDREIGAAACLVDGVGGGIKARVGIGGGDEGASIVAALRDDGRHHRSEHRDRIGRR